MQQTVTGSQVAVGHFRETVAGNQRRSHIRIRRKQSIAFGPSSVMHPAVLQRRIEKGVKTVGGIATGCEADVDEDRRPPRIGGVGFGDCIGAIPGGIDLTKRKRARIENANLVTHVISFGLTFLCSAHD